jgi:hypothetical protein
MQKNTQPQMGTCTDSLFQTTRINLQVAKGYQWPNDLMRSSGENLTEVGHTLS